MSWFNQVNKKDNKAEILIYGAIGSGWYSSVGAETIAKELNAVGTITEIDVRINSPGGSVFDGVAIYNTLKNHPAKVNIIVDGLCASIATVIAMAGDTITMGTGTKFMIHNPLTICYGESEDLKKDAKILDGIKDDIIDAYMTKVSSKGISREKIAQMMDEESYLSANQALEYGFITNVVEQISMPEINNYSMLFGNTNFSNTMAEEGIIKKVINYFQNNSKEEKEVTNTMKLTKDEIRAQYPDVCNEIRNEGVEQERARIKDLENLIGKGNDAIVNKAKFQEPKNANEIALDILNSKNTEKPKNKVECEEKNDEEGDAQSNFLDKFEDKKADSKHLDGVHRGPVKENNKRQEIIDYAAKLAEKMKR
ncbi:MAG: head maturation protease, ClpP-related [Fusobacteriaceae bacterium]